MDIVWGCGGWHALTAHFALFMPWLPPGLSAGHCHPLPRSLNTRNFSCNNVHGSNKVYSQTNISLGVSINRLCKLCARTNHWIVPIICMEKHSLTCTNHLSFGLHKKNKLDKYQRNVIFISNEIFPVKAHCALMLTSTATSSHNTTYILSFSCIHRHLTTLST